MYTPLPFPFSLLFSLHPNKPICTMNMYYIVKWRRSGYIQQLGESIISLQSPVIYESTCEAQWLKDGGLNIMRFYGALKMHYKTGYIETYGRRRTKRNRELLGELPVLRSFSKHPRWHPKAVRCRFSSCTSHSSSPKRKATYPPCCGSRGASVFLDSSC